MFGGVGELNRRLSPTRRERVVAEIRALTAGLSGAAQAAWPRWTADATSGRGPAPELLRIGVLDVEGEEVPACVPLLDRAHLAVEADRAADADGLIAAVLLRAIGSVPPGTVRLAVYDPDRLGGSLSAFAPLAAAGLAAFHGPGDLGGLLDAAVEHIRHVNERVLAGEYASVAELARATGRRPEPWRVLVLLGGDPDPGQLDRILRTGVAAGLHVIGRGIPMRGAESVSVTRAEPPHSPRLGRSTVTGPAAIRLDEPPPVPLVAATARLVADVVTAGPAPTVLADYVPEKLWLESATHGLTAPIGLEPEPGGAGHPLPVTLGDHPPHALIGGPSGSGKTNLIYAWIAALTTRYSPAELALYLLDFKEGVSFARFAPGRRDPSWLPHVRLVGMNINHDREFGLALLRFLADELRRRAAAARAREVTKLAELRAEDPAGRWPRIVAVIDEFQVLLAARDAVTAEAVALLEDLARRGRSQGIHLVLASQDVAGIEALWGRAALIGQFALRIALPKARRILADTNPAAETVARWHAVVNADSGAEPANRTVRLPDAGDRDTWERLQRAMWAARDPDAAPPRLFDGDAVPGLDLLAGVEPTLGSESWQFAHEGTGRNYQDPEPRAVVGEAISVVARAATMTLARTPGRNLAVLGSRREDAESVLAAAARSLAVGCPSLRFLLVCGDGAAEPAAQRLAAALPPGSELIGAASAATALAGLVEPRIVVGYGWDAAPPSLRASGVLRDLLHTGPERGIHVLGWWRGVARLRDDLGGPAARVDPIGAFVALDVHGSELAALCPVPGGPVWYPRPRRALFFDRAVHRVPEIVIPYRNAS